MYTCLCCNTNTKSAQSLTAHIRINHKINKKEYYDTYLKKENEGLCAICHKETTFRGSSYLKFCSRICYIKSNEFIENCKNANLGRKQPTEVICKRVSNTNQKEKELSRQKTLLEKYSSLSTLTSLSDEQKLERNTKISNIHKGKKHSVCHHEKVIQSKRKKGTLFHTDETKRLISEKITALHNSADPPVTLSTNSGRKGKNGKGHLCGTYNGVTYRSSYELVFLSQCKERDMLVVSAGTKEHRISYIDKNGKKRMYYPDFYLPAYNILVEIKPQTMLQYNSAKIEAGVNDKRFSYVVLTEEHLLGNSLWVDNFEHILS